MKPGRTLTPIRKRLNAKARTRVRSVLNRSARLVVGNMNVPAIRSAEPRLQDLFDQVLERSPFTFGRLNMGVYPAWKMHWKNDLIFRSYHLDGELVGFATAFVLGDTLDVQFVGIDYTHNQDHGIYQRMLVDLLDVGSATRPTSHPFRSYGRTSKEQPRAPNRWICVST